jgi:hypothetical protein
MASYPVPSPSSSGDGAWAGGPKRPRAEMTGFMPSPTDALYLVSPFLLDESTTLGSTPAAPPNVLASPAANDELADARAILNDFVLLSSTGHCLFETLSRGITQKTWLMSGGQRAAYYEGLAQVVRANQNTAEMNGLLQNFCNGAPSLANLGKMIQEAQGFLKKSIESITSSMPSPNYSAFSKSPDLTWTMFTTGAGAQGQDNPGSRGSGCGSLDGRGFSSLSQEQTGSQLQARREETSVTPDDGNMIVDKTDARKKTVTALNRMKQFVVPQSASDTNSMSSSAVSDASSTGLSPNMTSLSSLPQYPFSTRPSFPFQQPMYPHSGSFVMSRPDNPSASPSAPGGSPDMGLQEAVVCRRKKPKVSDSAGPKGVSKTGSTWRIQVQIRGGIIVDPFGNTTERKKYRFSRYVSDYAEVCRLL